MTQRDVPGIDEAFLAMDTEEGVEVVWNEVKFSQRKSYKAQEVSLLQLSMNELCQQDTSNETLLYPTEISAGLH